MADGTNTWTLGGDVYAEETAQELTVRVGGNEVFGPQGVAVVRQLCDQIERSKAETVIIDVREVSYFCSSALGRLAECIARLRQQNRAIRMRAKGYALRALEAIGFHHVVAIDS